MRTVAGDAAGGVARLAGSSIARPEAAAWVAGFLDAAYYGRAPGARDVADLRLAHCVLTTYWHRLGRRLRLTDALAFAAAFGSERLLDRSTSEWRTLPAGALAAGAERLLGPGFGAAAADPERRGWGIAFPDVAARAAYAPERRLRDAALGALTPPRAAADERTWALYPPVALPSAAAAVALLEDPSRWPDFGSALGRFTALRPGGLDGQSFEIDVVARAAPGASLLTRAYVSATARHTSYEAISDALAGFAWRLPEPPLPAGARGRLLVELTTHEGHFLGPAVSRLLVWEDTGGRTFVRAIGTWDPLAWHLQPAYRLAGRAAQLAFWGGGDPADSMLHRLAATAREDAA